jgi:hypothetical protein
MNANIDFRAIAAEALDAHPTSNFYFLLDHAGMPGLHRKLSKTSLMWESLFEDTKEKSALAVSPVLILAGTKGKLHASRSFLSWIAENGTYSSSVVMLSSPLGIAPLRQRLATRLEVGLSEDMDALLRFFDPRVLESLMKILNENQVRDFLSLAESWKYIDRTGNLVEHQAAFVHRDSFNVPLALSQEQECGLIQLSEIDQVIGLLQENLPELLATLALPEKYIYVSRVVDCGRNDGLDSVLKLTLYAAVILSNGEEVAESPVWEKFVDGLKIEDFASIQSLHQFDIAVTKAGS